MGMWGFDLRGRLTGSAILAVVVLALVGCKASTENQLLAESSLTMEDPKFYPSDEYLRLGKVHFRHGDYGLAEKEFRKGVEVTPNDVEAWLGLAASYDQLRRFDLADKAYERVLVLNGKNVAVLNNIGYSYLLRGDTQKARRFLLKAYELEPKNPYIVANLLLLNDSAKTIKRANL
jgi:Flp pilus assembly protein TadD